ncbi:MAG: hypothetical protein GX085_02355 [Firmicutes bacterium]|nr:hypothetical protein [Bacillota bacterium]
MRLFQKSWFLFLFFIPFLLTKATGETAPDFFPLAKIEPGMKAQCYTVFKGDKVESFPVEIVGVVEGSGPVRQFILIKFTGENNGAGISAGMSGSPVFIGNRLAGAIGYGFHNADPRYGLVTPIEDMLKLWDEPVTDLAREVYYFQRGGLDGFKGVAFGENTSDLFLQARPVATPLLLSDPNPRAFRLLSAYFPEDLVFPVAGGLRTRVKGKDKNAEDFAPGSALSILLADGDYQVAALGTVTWVENRRFLAFGHPFLNRGYVEYGAGGAYIHEIIDSRVMPFKLGSTLPVRALVTRDRGAGIAGELDAIPETVKVSTRVLDKETGREGEYVFQVIRDEEFLPGLVLAGVISFIDRTLDRIGPGTAAVRFIVTGENLPPIERENLYYGEDIAIFSINEIGRFIQLLTDNEFLPVNIEEIAVEVEVVPERLSARLTRLDLPKKEFFPGEELTVTGVVFPFRGEEVEIPVEIKIPEDFPPGEWILSAHGSSYKMTVGEEEEEAGEIPAVNAEGGLEGLESVTSLEELVKKFLTRPANNDLVVEVYPFYPPEKPGDDNGESSSGKKWTVSTDYYLLGEKQVAIKVIGEETMENEENGEEVSETSGTKSAPER